MFQLSENEENLIDELMEKICEDLDEIYEKAEVDEFRVKIKFNFNDLEENDDPILYMDDYSRQILVIDEDGEEQEEYDIDDDGLSGGEDSYRDSLEFIRNYPINRNRIINRLRELKQSKKEVFKEVKKVQDFFENRKPFDVDELEETQSEATIQIELPVTNNRHEIEVSHEDGKTIGIIRLGAETIKIVTNGNLAVVNKDEKDGPKVKKL